MQLRKQWSVVRGRWSAVGSQRGLRLMILTLCTLHFALCIGARAEDRFSIKYQRYEDDKSIYYKDTKGVTSDRWLIAISKAITEKTSLALNYGVDAISSASWKIDAVTSASRRAGEETRYSGGLGINQMVGKTTVSAGGGGGGGGNQHPQYPH